MNRRTLLLLVLAVVAVAAAVIAVVLLHPVAASHPATAPSTPTSSASPRPARATARERAWEVADTFCQPGKTVDLWQRSLAPLLTVEAKTMFAATNPANVPCEHVDEASGQAAGDQQTSTDAAWQFAAGTGGPVTVTLHRSSSDASWEASYVQPGS